MTGMTADKEFIRNLSDDEAKEALAIEAELEQVLKQGLTEETALSFVRAVMAIRSMVPKSTVGGIHDTALQVGLREMCVKLIADRGTKRKTVRKAGILR